MVMSARPEMGHTASKTNRWIAIGAAVVLFGAIAVDTTVITIGSDEDARQQAFSPDAYGANEFPRIRDSVIDRAVAASALAEALAQNKKAAIAQYATHSGTFPVFPVQFTGTVGAGSSGIFEVSVAGLGEGTIIRVQSGPAINGTELRDIPGDIEFGAFTNQIEYQNVGAGINRAMSAAVLNDLDRDNLSGKTVSVTGVFTLINPKNWLVTPVELDVQ